MPSTRRMKILGLMVALILVSILYLTGNAHQSNREFYDRTVQAMEAKAIKPVEVAEQEVRRKTKEAGSAAKEESDPPVQNKPPEIVLGGDNSQGVRKKVKGGEKWDVSSGRDSADGKKEATKPKTEEEKDTERELNSILKRSPIIIFSKSYCPFSKKAKKVFEMYSIIPAPHIVELDEHHMGQKLQDALLKTTSRQTVPNILINGMSIGGGDDVEKLHLDRELIDKIKTMGRKRIMEAKLLD